MWMVSAISGRRHQSQGPSRSGQARDSRRLRNGVVVIGLLNLAAHLSPHPTLVVNCLAGLAAGGWCSLNFWWCRHAHCLITGPGWLAFGLFALVEASLGHSVIGGFEQPVFSGLLAVGGIFELCWYGAHHTNAVVSHQPSRVGAGGSR